VKHQTKVLLKVLGILVATIVIFFLGIGVGAVGSEPECPECEVCENTECPEPKVVTKEVEVIEYQDNPETLEQLEFHKTTACSYTSMYGPLFDITLDYADIFGLGEMVTDDMYNLNSYATEYQALYCN
jgi:hypothetical protein